MLREASFLTRLRPGMSPAGWWGFVGPPIGWVIGVFSLAGSCKNTSRITPMPHRTVNPPKPQHFAGLIHAILAPMKGLVRYSVLWAAVGGLVGALIGSSKGYGVAGFFLGFLLGFIGWIIVAVLEPTEEVRQQRQLEMAATWKSALSNGPSDRQVQTLGTAAAPRLRAFVRGVPSRSKQRQSSVGTAGVTWSRCPQRVRRKA
jgi:hypothetical protein